MCFLTGLFRVKGRDTGRLGNRGEGLSTSIPYPADTAETAEGETRGSGWFSSYGRILMPTHAETTPFRVPSPYSYVYGDADLAASYRPVVCHGPWRRGLRILHPERLGGCEWQRGTLTIAGPTPIVLDLTPDTTVNSRHGP